MVINIINSTNMHTFFYEKSHLDTSIVVFFYLLLTNGCCFSGVASMGDTPGADTDDVTLKIRDSDLFC